MLASLDDDEEFDDAPFATVDEMLGLFVVMKFPQICLNARAMSGPTLDAAGPKSAIPNVVSINRCCNHVPSQGDSRARPEDARGL